MKVVNWNCNMAFRKKAIHLIDMQPDLMVIPECESLEKLTLESNSMNPSDKLWIGNNNNKGLGVFAFNNFKIDIHDAYNEDFEYVLPIKVQGSINFNLIAVWAMNNKIDYKKRYIGQVWLALNYYKDLLNEPTIIVGDFNWNKVWDDSSNLYGNLTDSIKLLGDKNIFSVYHRKNDVEFGVENNPTLFMHRKKDKPYHVDYCFASNCFLEKLVNMEIGKYEDWIEFSDHMPIITEYSI